MRTHGIWIAAALAATLRGLGGVECEREPVEVVSLNGVTSDSARILDSALVGTWMESGGAECDTGLVRAEAAACTCKSLVVRLEAERSHYVMRALSGDWREVLSDAPGIGLLGDDWQTVATGTTEEMRQWIERRFKPQVFATASSTTVPYDRKVYVRARSATGIGERVTGSYRSDDCIGRYSGAFSLAKQ